MGEKVLLGFSGGMDSCAAAGILRDEGYDVTLAFLDMLGHAETTGKARQAASSLGLPLRIIDVRETFEREVVAYFADGYAKGETPAPCSRCNPAIKWKYLYETAVASGFERIATGHYFRIGRDSAGRCSVRRAADRNKDQSYYLWGVPQHCLRMAVAPLGDRIKSELRDELPEELHARESMGVCFLKGRPYGDFLRERLPEIRPGEIVDRQGRRVGTHEGYVFYTIGQKRGLGRTVSGPVVAIDAAANRIVTGTPDDLWYRTLYVRETYVPAPERLKNSDTLRIMIRGIGRNPQGRAEIHPEGNGTARIELDDPAWAPAPGQPVVFYDGDTVVGGGILDRTDGHTDRRPEYGKR